MAEAGAGPTPAAQRRILLALWLVAVYAAIQVALWTLGTGRAIATAAAWIGVLGSVLAERVSVSKLGLGRVGLRDSLWIVPAALGLLGVTTVIGWLCGSLHGLAEEALWWRIPAYLPWAFTQQFAAQCFFFRRLEVVSGSGFAAVLVTSLLFAGAHLPNPVLAPATLLAEFLWTLAYRRYRNLYAISIAHALLAAAFTVAVSDAWHHHMRVGIGYLLYRAH
jgi:membrane protease YdiL (CAAX protease family)